MIYKFYLAQTKPIIAIVNVVSSATLDQKLDLVKIVKKFPVEAEYELNREERIFPGLVFRLKDPRTATLIFGTGSMVCTGATSEEFSIKAVNMVVKKLRKGKIRIKNKPTITIQNIVSSINLGGKIDLLTAARCLPRSLYEPEMFPAIIHRLLDPKTVILIFASGKLVCVGAKIEEDIHRSVHQTHALLEEKELMIYN